jgi:hypothetical protein
MNKTDTAQDPTPEGCFRLDELRDLQSAEGFTLADCNYYLWLNRNENDPEAAPLRFLYALELIFEEGETLLLSSGEDSEAIRLISEAELVKTAEQLRTLQGYLSIQRVNVGTIPLWQPCIGKHLVVRLSRHESGLFLNDALLLDFAGNGILLGLASEGLSVSVYQ